MLATLSAVRCTPDTAAPTGSATQEVINPPLPGNLKLALHARTTVTLGPFAGVVGDVGSTGRNGSIVFGVSAAQSCCEFNVLASTVRIEVGAEAGRVFGNDITNDGSVLEQFLGLDPSQLPQIPAATPATPGTANITTNQNQARQLCPGRYGAISVGVNSTLNLNGGVYHVSRLTLADGARLEPSEPVVIVVAGAMTTAIGSFIQPSPQSLNPMSAGNIRFEVGGAVTIGERTQVRAHILAPTSTVTTNRLVVLVGAVWARAIHIGAETQIGHEDVLGATPSVPPPCNDNNACTADVCVGGGTAVASCRNTPVPSGTSCDDDNLCNGSAACDGAGTCQPGTNAAAGTSCTDHDACNGDETCDGLGTCAATPPRVNDGNSCTVDACDPTTGVSHVPLQDGTICSGTGVCQAGVCSVQRALFSENFLAGQSATIAQCDRWNDFRANELGDGPYRKITMSGTFEPAGVSCSDPVAASQICQALHRGSAAAVPCNGHVWTVGPCGGVELNLDVGTCNCEFGAGHAIVPCIFNPNWGGVNTDTCDPPSQNISVACE